MDDIYNLMIINNIKKINDTGFNYDELLLNEKDERYCYAIFSIIKQTSFNPIFYKLQQSLSLEQNGITYYINNKNLHNGTFHFTFMQQLSFNNYYDLSQTIINQYNTILSSLFKNNLPFTITYNKLIIVPNGLVLCGDASININKIRDEYREICKTNNLPLIEPYYLNIIHSTLFRFTHKENSNEFMKRYDEYLNKNINFGHVVIDDFNIGKATWKVNFNEILVDGIINNGETVVDL
jgi:hypothetical protein